MPTLVLESIEVITATPDQIALAVKWLRRDKLAFEALLALMDVPLQKRAALEEASRERARCVDLKRSARINLDRACGFDEAVIKAAIRQAYKETSPSLHNEGDIEDMVRWLQRW